MITQPFERFVNADEAAEFLSITRRRVLDLARRKLLPSHSIGAGARRVWRFRLSELSNAVASRQNSLFTPELVNSRENSSANQGFGTGDSDVAKRMADKTSR
jgi:hypothetical protein